MNTAASTSMSLTGASKKKKKLSKNKKKNQRKTDITDVEDYLESVRIQERAGGLTEDKLDEELFFEHTTPAAVTVESTANKAPKTQNGFKKKEIGLLKCHSALVNTSSVKPSVTSRPKSQRVQDLKYSAGPNSVAQKQLENSKASAKLNNRKRSNYVTKPTGQLWDETEEEPKSDIHHLVTKQRVKRPRRAAPSTLPAVEVPHPGQSYNPTAEDYVALMRQAHEVEVKKDKTLQKEKRALDDMFPAESGYDKEKLFVQEMSGGLFDLPRNDEEDGKEEEVGKVVANPPIRRENKKTEKQRKKELARKKKEDERLAAKAAKVKGHEIFQLKSLKRQAKQHHEKIQQTLKERAAEKEAKRAEPKKLSKYKYEEAPIAVKLSAELDNRLYRLKPEGNPVGDLLNRLQKRNIIETRKKALSTRKYKPKTFTKKGHAAVV